MKITLVILCLCLLQSCGKTRPTVDYLMTQDFSGLHNYYLLPVDENIFKNPRISKLEINRTREALFNELSQSFTRVGQEQAEFLVQYHLLIEDRVKVSSQQTSVGMYGGSHRYHYGIHHNPSVRTTNYQYNKIIIEVINPLSQETIWRGSTGGRMMKYSTPEERTAKIQEYVQLICNVFPPKNPAKE